MTKNRFQTLLIWGLLLSNILLIGFLFVRRGGRPDGNRPKRIIIERLALDDTQIKQYETIITQHRAKIRQHDTELIALKNSLYQTLLQDKPATDSLMTALMQVHRDIEMTHFNHFIDIKKLCKPEQMPKYQALVGELSELFAQPHPPKR